MKASEYLEVFHIWIGHDDYLVGVRDYGNEWDGPDFDVYDMDGSKRNLTVSERNEFEYEVDQALSDKFRRDEIDERAREYFERSFV